MSPVLLNSLMKAVSMSVLLFMPLGLLAQGQSTTPANMASGVQLKASPASVRNGVTRVVYPSSMDQSDPRSEYFFKLLKLSLRKSQAAYGPFELSYSKERLPERRIIELLKTNQVVNVLTSPTSAYLEGELLAIKLPTLRGIQGLRLSLIHQDNKYLFENMTQLSSMKAIRFGQGANWLDLKIFQRAGIDVYGVNNYSSLFAMVQDKRIDAFPRGINEIYRELSVWSRRFRHLMIDPYLVMYYPFPVYFFVAKGQQALHDRIATGMTLALNDGSFAALFDSYFKQALDDARLPFRKAVKLDNPYLPDHEVPISFWHPYIRRHYYLHSM